MKKSKKYSEAGVNLENADLAKAKLGDLVRGTFNDKVGVDYGDFGAAFSLNGISGANNFLVSSTDGVGTKLKLAFMSGRHDTIGHDLVNHLTNDILCLGAKPLFFMDYIGLGNMEPDVVYSIVKGITNGCKENECALLGGETAEMPGFYSEGEYDLAGFMVGVANKNTMPDKNSIKAGDVLIGFSSSGLHTNGYSLARHAFFEKGKMSIEDIVPETGNKLGDDLLNIHISYFDTIYPFMKKKLIKAVAHITGGGFEGNISRILPDNVDAVVETGNWFVPGIFKAIQRLAEVETDEMYRVFNMGIGLVTVAEMKDIPKIKELMKSPKCEVVPIGMITEGTGKVIVNV